MIRRIECDGTQEYAFLKELERRSGETDRKVTVMTAEAEKQAATILAEGESEYMRILQEAYNSPDKADFYNFTRSLDALKESLTGGNKTLMLDKDSELAKILYGNFGND